MRRLENAIPVSYLQPADNGPFPPERGPFSASERAVGDRVPTIFSGEGERALSDNLRVR